jgi:DNA repair protein RecO
VFSYATDRNLAPLTEWSLQDGHLELRSSLRAVHLAQYSAELVAMLLEEHDPHASTFDRLEKLLVDLASPRLEESFLAFQLELLRESGYLPELATCVDCSRTLDGRDRAFFSAAKGAVVCRNCEALHPDRIEVDGRLLQLAQTILKLPTQNGSTARLPRLTRHQTDPLNRLLLDHVEHTLQRRLRTGAYVVARR